MPEDAGVEATDVRPALALVDPPVQGETAVLEQARRADDRLDFVPGLRPKEGNRVVLRFDHDRPAVIGEDLQLTPIERARHGVQVVDEADHAAVGLLGTVVLVPVVVVPVVVARQLDLDRADVEPGHPERRQHLGQAGTDLVLESRGDVGEIVVIHDGRPAPIRVVLVR